MKFSDMPYTRVDFEKLKTEFAEMGRAFDAAKSGEEQFELHKKYYKLTDHVMTEMTIAEIRHDIDMTDEFYAAEQKFYDENAPVFRNLVVAWQRKLYESRFRPYLEMRIGKVAFKNIELAMKSVDEKLIPLMQEENRLQDDYNRILATAKLDWNGETLNLSLLSPYLNNRSREVRKKAWDLYSGFFAEHAEEFDDIYDKLVKNRTKQGELMGYENYLPLGYARMMRNCYGRSDIQEFRKQVKQDWVPLCQDLNEMRRQKLGLPHLTYIDEGVYLPDGNPNPIGTPEQILMAGRKMYNELSPETAKFMNFMCDNELFDVLGRKTKKVGGYMTYLPDYKAPFIFANFNGTADDADVITHECGHAFQGYLVADDPIREHADITMETAETHSMSMEFFTEPWMNLLFTSTCISCPRSSLFRTERWSMSSRTSRTRIRRSPRRREMRCGATSRGSTSRTLIIPATRSTRAARSGRTSITSMTARCTTSTTASRGQMRCSTRSGWTRTTAGRGTRT